MESLAAVAGPAVVGGSSGAAAVGRPDSSICLPAGGSLLRSSVQPEEEAAGSAAGARSRRRASLGSPSVNSGMAGGAKSIPVPRTHARAMAVAIAHPQHLTSNKPINWKHHARTPNQPLLAQVEYSRLRSHETEVTACICIVVVQGGPMITCPASAGRDWQQPPPRRPARQEAMLGPALVLAGRRRPEFASTRRRDRAPAADPAASSARASQSSEL